jgi:transposase
LLSGSIQARRTEVKKATRAKYTLEFKLEAVRLVKGGQSMAATAKILGIAEQTLHNWIKADKDGRLAGAGAKPVSPSRWRLRGCAPNWRG